ncbi:MAG: ureidoglycolate lyase [Alphaproteobacteria bacterium]|nr:ureidoglycolate lyase [Alphaproteobacteria bacterium]
MRIEPLTRQAFAPFGDVIETQGAHHFTINQGFATRFDDLCKVDVVEGGEVKVSIFEARPRPQPIRIDLMERHPLGSQAFYPLQDEDWLVLVCANPREAGTYRCFRATGRQGVNYARNVWHFPLLVFAPARFIIVDRKGPGNNLEEVMLEKALSI